MKLHNRYHIAPKFNPPASEYCQNSSGDATAYLASPEQETELASRASDLCWCSLDFAGTRASINSSWVIFLLKFSAISSANARISTIRVDQNSLTEGSSSFLCSLEWIKPIYREIADWHPIQSNNWLEFNCRFKRWKLLERRHKQILAQTRMSHAFQSLLSLKSNYYGSQLVQLGLFVKLLLKFIPQPTKVCHRAKFAPLSTRIDCFAR